jgi:hypothetical protein
MAAENFGQTQLEVGHVLFIDLVGYSKFSINEQHAAVEQLNRIVRASEQFQQAETASRLLKIPTGDGMALVFYTSRRRLCNARSRLVAHSSNIHGCKFGWEFTAVRLAG